VVLYPIFAEFASAVEDGAKLKAAFPPLVPFIMN